MSLNLIDKLREHKIPGTNGMVIFDWATTILGAATLSYLFANNLEPSYILSFITIFIILIVLSIILHIQFNIPTVTNYYLGLSEHPLDKKNI